MHWNQQQVVKAISAAPRVGRVDMQDQWGDYCTNALIVWTKDGIHKVYVLGFRTGRVIEPKDAADVDVEMVELSDGTDSRGGLQSSEPEVIRLYAEVRIALAGLGATVVDQMKDYF